MNFYLIFLIVLISVLHSYTNGDENTTVSANNVLLRHKRDACYPPCQNGGNCISFNICQCPQEFRGPQCQYSASACSASKLQFNGIPDCWESDGLFVCSLSCPQGTEFESTPAFLYTCDFATATFEPEHIPQCLFSEYSDALETGPEPEPYYKEYEDTPQLFYTTTDSIISQNIVGENTNEILENKPHPGNCFTWSGSHFKTFDGRVFSFTSSCAHTLVRDNVDNTFSVIVHNSQGCLNEFEKCYSVINIYLQDQEYILKHSAKGVPIFVSGDRILPIPGRVPGIRTGVSAQYIIIFLDIIGAKIKWDRQQLVQVEVKESLWNKTAGLCGKIDGDSSNDMLTKENSKPESMAALARSWQVEKLGEVCEDIPQEQYVCQGNTGFEAALFCDELFSDKRFALCRMVMDVKQLMDACIWDYCSCKHANPKECACETLNVYVRECAYRGVTAMTRWRDEHTCPIQCDGGRMYMPCAPAGGQALCGGASEKLDEDAECEEGCYCPVGTFLHNSTCIARENCPCIHRGKEYPPSSSIPQECNTCTCSNDKWICTQLTCGTRCSVIGDPHYITFDGKHYDFMGKCTYTLVEHDNFTIEVENVPCGGANAQAINFPDNVASCPRTVIVKISGQTIKIKQGREVTINGQEVPKIPFQVSGAVIRVASSLYLLVELPNGGEVWWDGVARVHVDVPPSFIGQTKGLCGTFNKNQKDDFLTPEGDIEQSAIPFANKWKTTEKCADVSETVYSHPCDSNIQNKAAAEEYCNIIRSQLFADCNVDVDQETFYQDCLYDLCSCTTKISNCLCPMIAAYAEECARKGIKVEWRNEINDCGMHCPGGQIYQICGNSCTRSCYDIAILPDCKQQCVEGCNCPEGEALNEHGECIAIGQCDCQQDGLKFAAGYKEIRKVSDKQELCVCVNAQWSCRPATRDEIVKYPKATETKTMCNATENKEFTSCEPVEPVTCKNMHSLEPVTTAICHGGCQCKPGYVLDGFSKTCVKPTECPCHHGGRSYSENSEMMSDCNTCTCKHGKWKCTDKLCPGECSAWGDSHYKTFDGRLYDFQGQCDYVLVKGILGNENAFDISLQNVQCGSLGVSCSKSISIRVGTSPNQESITLTREKEIPEHTTLKQLIIRQKGHFVIVEAPELNFLVHWDKGTRVYVKLETLWKNKVKGLCGNYNDNQLDDFQTPNGGIAEVSSQLFGDSWRLQPYCPKALDITNTCEQRPDRKVWALKQCGILKSSVFASCHSEVPIEIYLERCLFDTCACDQGGDCECLCTALATYAQECNNKGIPIKWRMPDLCPMQCDERCSHYSPCISTCPIETCDNTLVYGQLKKMCDQDTCIEGCQAKPCPPNFVYTNSSMLECIRRNICKPVCLEIEGVEYFEGDIVEEDFCHTCYCSRGKKHCQGKPCVTTPEPLHEEVKCHSGWTDWINQDNIPFNKMDNQRKSSDREPLPKPLIMNNLKGKSRCDIQNITDIECRTVNNHLSHKETGLDVECSLERGLICSSTEEPCVDFEIRVKCECAPPVELIEPTSSEVCDISEPNREHHSNCHLYYKCELGENGPELVEKKCDQDMMYNSLTFKCDFPATVFKIKPKCSQQFLPTCSAGEEFRDCAIQCNRLCLHYSHQIKQSGHCLHGKNCEKGCVSKKNPDSCPPGMYWTGRHCVFKKDCMCVSRDGTPVKAGNTFKESECEICQCVNNHYTCDNSACATTPSYVTLGPTSPPPEFCDVSQPKQEHYSSCYLYYKCEDGENGPELVEKVCDSDLMFNPTISECDFPDAVIQIKPQCSKEFLPTCSAGEEFRDCAIQCNRLCLHYSHQIKQSGHCLHRNNCEKGCVSKKNPDSCPPGMYWAGRHCVFKKDCMCVSRDGTPVKAGNTFKESECEICQCLNNRYICDNSACVTTSSLPSYVTLGPTSPPPEFCDVSQPKREHYSSCYLYYKCEDGENGPELVEKVCDSDLMFNPTISECDFPDAVIQIKPQCSKEFLPTCSAGEEFRDCAIQCNRLCLHYSHQIKQSGHCLHRNNCEKGCVSKKNPDSCPPGMYWAGRHCVFKKDCMCVSRDGTPVKAGNTFKESECEICQCLNNRYICDNSACVTTSSLPSYVTLGPTSQPPEFCDVSQPKREHYSSCYLYYKCEDGENGPELVEKVCDSDLMFNPTTSECDFPDAVIQIKPQCSKKAPYKPIVPPTTCPAGEEFQDCSVRCHRMCMYYSHQMRQNGHCLHGKNCEKGCVSTRKKPHSCPPGEYSINNYTCIPIKDCICVSSHGTPVNAGETFKESECKVCKCHNNRYTCDTSACLTTHELPAIATTKPTWQTETTSLITPIAITPITVTPPAECSKDGYINLVDGDIPLADDAFTASSILSSEFSPKFARLNSEVIGESGGYWAPQISDKHQYLQINLGRQEPVYGIVIKGSPLRDEYVTSYTIVYSPDGYRFSSITDHNKKPTIFRGSFDGSTPSEQMFEVPIEAKIIRINPKTWHNAIALKVELIGCKKLLTAITITEPTIITTPTPYCSDSMGVDNMMMADQQISVSSELKPHHLKDQLKINGKNAWQPSTNSPTQWVQFDFLEPRNITGFVTRGGARGWVTAFNVMYSHTGKDWNLMLDDKRNEYVFPGNVDSNTPHVIKFDLPVQTKLLKITPAQWHQNIQLRIEPRGCFIPYPSVEFTTIQVPPSKCNNCQGVFMSDSECICKEDLWWDGKNCVAHTECPCMVGDIRYAVGTAFENEDCADCTCQLNGISHCNPKVCDRCEEDQRSVVTSTCECICRRCDEGTRLCPTSNICINNTDWCNGVKDCTDDETDCIVTPGTLTSTVPTEISKPKKCREPFCASGYKAVLKKQTKPEELTSSLNTIFSSNKKTTHSKSARSFKGGHRIGNIQKPTITHKKIVKEKECAVFECIPVKIPPPFPGSTPAPCPEIICPPGYTLDIDIIEETAACPRYECIPSPPVESVCNVTGHAFSTFDLTDYIYDICNHILVRDLENNQWEISIKKNCTIICSRDLIIHHEEHTIVLHPDLSIEYDDFKYTVEQTKKISSHSHFFEISLIGEALVFASNKYGFWVIWDKQTNAKIGITRKLLGTVDGLCGYFNDNPKDDKRKPDGTLAKTSEEFGNSWGKTGAPVNCETRICRQDNHNKAAEICNLVKQKTFNPCARALKLDAFVSRCLETTCACLEAALHDKEAEEKCRCLALQDFVVDCLTANSDLEVIDWRMKYNCPATCESPFVHHDCYRRRCEPSCGALGDSNACPKLSHVCFPGCYCPPGYVRKGEDCILPVSCGDCECNVLPHLEYVTYDERNFTVNGNCVYVMSRDVLDQKNKEHKFQVLITNNPCHDKKDKTCVEKVTILYKGHEIDVVRDISHSKLKLLVDSDKISDFKEIEGWTQVKKDPVQHLRILLTEIQVLVSVYYPSLGVSIKAPSLIYGGKLEGLCGDCDADKDNDLVIRKDTITSDVNEFGLSWLYEGVPGGQSKEQCTNQPEQVCEEVPAEFDPCIQLEDGVKYGECHPVLDPDLFIEWCKKDMCNAHPKYACSAIATYSLECGHLGFCIDWHTHLCPAKKCPIGQEYRPCAPACSEKCDTLKEKEKKCNNAPVEGCFCPEGKVFLNDTCVVKERCEACDDEGHYSGDTWHRDKCTKCMCEGTSLQCDTQKCPFVKTVCADGFTIKKISSEDECCDNYTCVQAPPTGVICEQPQEIPCNSGQVLKLITRADRCLQYVCECKPPKECEPLNKTSISLKPGFVPVTDETGCCPVLIEICNITLCPKAHACPNFHTYKEVPAAIRECCPGHSCLAPKNKCIVDLVYTIGENGGARPRNEFERQQVLKEANEKWQDGPCRECQCVVSPSGDYHDVCTVAKCPVLTESIDYQDYVLELQPVVGQCCDIIKKVACKHNGQAYEVGVKLAVDGDPCTTIECVEEAFGIQKVMQVTSCDTKCDLGQKYTAASLYSKECCGSCTPVACVADGIIHEIGEEWTSSDYCTNYYCLNINGSVQIESRMVNCPELPEELLKDYDVKIITTDGSCCKRHRIVACKDGNKIYEVGEIWPSPDGDKCKKITCTENKPGEIFKQESVETCNANCLLGQEYIKSDSKCCGECAQVACAVDNQLKTPDENWTSADGCTTYFCDRNGDQFTVISQQESCPDIRKCLPENIYTKGCCKHCKMVPGAQVTCDVEKMDPLKTIGLISIIDDYHGKCENKDMLEGFTECIGSCTSFTSFNSKSGDYESICSCCQVEEYTNVIIKLECAKGHHFDKEIRIPSKCECKECISEKIHHLHSKTGPKIGDWRRFARFG